MLVLVAVEAVAAKHLWCYCCYIKTSDFILLHMEKYVAKQPSQFIRIACTVCKIISFYYFVLWMCRTFSRVSVCVTFDDRETQTWCKRCDNVFGSHNCKRLLEHRVSTRTASFGSDCVELSWVQFHKEMHCISINRNYMTVCSKEAIKIAK